MNDENVEQLSVRLDIEKLYDHATIANNEMGTIKSTLSVVQNDISWIKSMLEKTENRTWLILSAIILTTIIQIAVKMLYK